VVTLASHAHIDRSFGRMQPPIYIQQRGNFIHQQRRRNFAVLEVNTNGGIKAGISTEARMEDMAYDKALTLKSD
jgi:hypothetical protein